MYDPIVEEVLKVREKLAEKYEYDIDKIFEDVKQREQQHPEKVVNLRSKTIKTT
jgi:hypothetical protein